MNETHVHKRRMDLKLISRTKENLDGISIFTSFKNGAIGIIYLQNS